MTCADAGALVLCMDKFSLRVQTGMHACHFSSVLCVFMTFETVSCTRNRLTLEPVTATREDNYVFVSECHCERNFHLHFPV